MKKACTIAFLVLWSAAMAFPMLARLVLRPAGLVTYAPFAVSSENRNPCPRPSLRRTSKNRASLRELGQRYEKWYNDAFPWRTEVLAFHRRVLLDWFKSPVGREVRGSGNWIFRRGGDWAELDDYLGAFELTAGELADWVALFEGRREWARALGSAFLVLPSPVKAQVCRQKLPAAIRAHRGRNVSSQVREALAGSPARDDVLFADGDFEAAVAAGREVFFDSDHHPSAYGLWLLYERINRRLSEVFPDRAGKPVPWFDDPPEEVRRGEAPGCWPEREGDLSDASQAVRLEVASPGESVVEAAAGAKGRRYPYCDVETVREGGGLSMLMGHDSYMRFTLASWRRGRQDVRFPFASGVGSVRACIFKRFAQGFLEDAITQAVPDVFVEQFPECRLDGSAHKYLDDNLRAAAVFGRAGEPSPGSMPQAGGCLAVRAVFEDVRAKGDAGPVASLLVDGRVLARRRVLPGVKRAVFFGPVAWPADAAEDAVPAVKLSRGVAASTDVSWRILPSP
ncbi:MAG: hypothetical protein IJS32_08425 [Kiritimatiellae bacterium]|nr:hypothetical protein [Kiritimatiellia bacterium]